MKVLRQYFDVRWKKQGENQESHHFLRCFYQRIKSSLITEMRAGCQRQPWQPDIAVWLQWVCFLKMTKILFCLFEDEYKNCVKWRFPPKFAKNWTLLTLCRLAKAKKRQSIGCPRIIRTCSCLRFSPLRWNRWCCGFQNFQNHSSGVKAKRHTLPKSAYYSVQSLDQVSVGESFFLFCSKTK